MKRLILITIILLSIFILYYFYKNFFKLTEKYDYSNIELGNITFDLSDREHNFYIVKEYYDGNNESKTISYMYTMDLYIKDCGHIEELGFLNLATDKKSWEKLSRNDLNTENNSIIENKILGTIYQKHHAKEDLSDRVSESIASAAVQIYQSDGLVDVTDEVAPAGDQRTYVYSQNGHANFLMRVRSYQLDGKDMVAVKVDYQDPGDNFYISYQIVDAATDTKKAIHCAIVSGETMGDVFRRAAIENKQH